jgi:multiple antibiotic resistance protein
LVETYTHIVENTLYFLALINPANKIFILSTMQPTYTWRELWAVSLRSTVVAFFILIILAASGQFLLVSVFHVQMYSLNVAGGIILFIIGLTAVRKGRFFEETTQRNVSEISIVPLASPLIAGPGTITAAIYYASLHGFFITTVCLSLALFINFLIMLSSLHIGEALERVNATSPLVRITGLIVSAVATQMVFSGVEEWVIIMLRMK